MNPASAGFFFAECIPLSFGAVKVLAALATVAAMLAPAPAHALDARQLALVVNIADPLSVEIAEYYAARRHIVFSNIIRVSLPPGTKMLTIGEFAVLKASVDEQTLPHVQAYALAWAMPYRVECMSMTSAMAFGFDLAFCADGCKPTRISPYFNSRAPLPHSRGGFRPAMAIAANTFEEAQALIDRGVKADGSAPSGTAYLLSTADAKRNVRARVYPLAEKVLAGRMKVRRLQQDTLFGAKDVFLYFTGKPEVEGLETLGFLPGAIADHLTSAGGVLKGGSQMSALRWLEAGATGSYGTVVEPCNMPEKFPDPAVLARHYLAGDTLIEAYWKSVAMPGQGIFIGEPLAVPFRRPVPR
jgi:uncharacterized protein (TIGR03790 family)